MQLATTWWSTLITGKRSRQSSSEDLIRFEKQNINFICNLVTASFSSVQVRLSVLDKLKTEPNGNYGEVPFNSTVST